MDSRKGKIGRTFHLDVTFFTGEKFKVDGCSSKMLVRELKEKLELIMGIPVQLQRLFYLDAADLIDSQPLKYVDIVPGALLNATVWNQWLSLVEAAVEGDVFKTLKQGVTKNSKYNDANSQNMLRSVRENWLQERAGVALFIASHRGHEQLVTRLLLSGTRIDAETPMGRTSLHASGCQGNVRSLLTLLQFGAPTQVCDKNGETALTLAASMGQRLCERYLFMHQWQQRAKRSAKYVDRVPLKAHQMYDTHLRTWYTGTKSRLYTAEILKPGEYSGTRINAPKRVPVAPRSKDDKRSMTAPEFASRRSKISVPSSKEGQRSEKTKAENIKLPLATETVKHEPYLPKRNTLKDDPSSYWPPAKSFLAGKYQATSGDNWISRKPESILEQFGVGTLQR